jgi:flagellar biosynthetic protein FliO
MDVMEQMAAVTLVFLLLGGALWTARRQGMARFGLAHRQGGSHRIECVDRLALGPQQTLHLVRLGETEMLVASTPAGCTLLKSFRRSAGEDAR